ncbi:MAG: hypothetical protein ACRC1K_10730 [Planctomycetia bacterium]
MAKAKSANPFIGRWRITEMDQWDQDYVNEEEDGYVEFTKNLGGGFHFGYVYGDMSCTLESDGGPPKIEWTFDGNDEMDHVMGRGWARIENGVLVGKIYFHHGDQSTFTATKIDAARSSKKN